MRVVPDRTELAEQIEKLLWSYIVAVCLSVRNDRARTVPNPTD
jgi:hypothetical protein